jgi:hypothetical protein
MLKLCALELLMAEQQDPDDDLTSYRQYLVAAEQKSQEDFDKTILALSGGALGISFTFLKDVIASDPISHPWLLLSSWGAWGLSTFAVLFSFYLSHLALRKAIAQVDNGSIRKSKVGGWFASATACLNAAGAVLFLAGVLCMTAFAAFNFTSGDKNGDTRQSTQTTGQNPTVDPGKIPTKPSAGANRGPEGTR